MADSHPDASAVTGDVTPLLDQLYGCAHYDLSHSATEHTVSALLLVWDGGALLAAATGRIRWRGDFGWTGLRTTATVIDRYDATPWRMSSQD